MAKDRLIIGLEIGTTKVVAVVAEASPDGSLRILGVGETKSAGVRKGEIVDSAKATQCVRDALADAEEKSDAEIRSVWVAVTGGHIECFNNRGAIVIPPERGEIEECDIEFVETNAREVSISDQHAFIHTMIQHYYVDNQDGVLNPIGMLGNKLEADFHIVHGIKTRIQNTLRCISDADVGVDDVVLNSVASAQVVLDQYQKDLGAIVLDIGGGTTDYLVYEGGVIRHTGVLAVGGDHITNDISIGLRIPIARAERLKTEEGSCLLADPLPGETIILKNDSGFSGCEVERSVLNRIIYARVREMFQLIYKDICSKCDIHLVGSGVMLTGGCCQLTGIGDIAEEVFELPVKLAAAQEIAGPTSVFKDPRYATAIGVVKYAQLMDVPDERPGLVRSLGRRLTGILRVFRLF